MKDDEFIKFPCLCEIWVKVGKNGLEITLPSNFGPKMSTKWQGKLYRVLVETNVVLTHFALFPWFRFLFN